MVKHNKGKIEAVALRQSAEIQLKNQKAEERPAMSEADMLKVFHELEVHQIELEMQNEELRRARDIAEKLSQKLTTIYDFAPVGYFTFEREAVISELNLSGARILGMDRSALINNNFRNFVSRDSLDIFDDFLEKVLTSDVKQTCTITLARRNFNSIVLYMEGIVSEEDTHCLVTAVDITEPHRMQVKLQHSETRYRRLFESAKDGILIVNAENGKIIDVNPFLVTMIGYSKEEILAKALWELKIFRKIAPSKEAFTEFERNNYIRLEEFSLKTKAGIIKEVEFVSSFYYEENKKVIQCNFRDITNRKHAEAALKKSESRLRELNVTKDKFSSIIGFSNLLAEKILAQDYPKVAEYADIIEKSSWRAMELLTNLIEWSNSQTGRINFIPEYFEFPLIVDEIYNLINDLAIQKSITVKKEISQSLIVFADKAMISTVLRNLVSNAIKYTHPGGKVTIKVEKDQHELMVSIIDDGIGLSNEAIENLFSIESNISTLGTQQERGTGLGLLLCKEFIQKHQGKIWVESIQGMGSKFNFTIPSV
jgi:two-component system sensor histidine kinase/response regulator